MNNLTRTKIAGMVAALGLIVAAPTLVLADGYSPLDLPDRGAGPSGVQGESTSSATPSPTAESTPDESAAEITSGTVQRVEGNQLVVEVNGEEREVDVPNDVRITRDGQDIELNAIEAGDVASFERNDEGEITEVRVASQQSMNFWRGFLPILAVVLVGFYLLSRRAKRTTA